MTSFCQACCLIREVGGIRHLHAHYANVPAKVALLVHRLTGTPYSITTHAKDIFQNNPFESPILKDRMRRAKFVVANSHFSAGHIRVGLDSQCDVQVVHNGLDLASFTLREQPPDQPVLLSVGRLVEKKGFCDLIAACQVLRQRGVTFSCEIVGTGKLSSQLKHQIRDCGMNDSIKLVGPLPQEVLQEHYRRAMIFALPCVRAGDGDRDVLPNAVKEAMAVGVPVVTTRLEGIEELVEHGVSGLLVEPGDVNGLAERLQELLGNPQLRQRLSVAGRQVIEARFDRRQNFAKLKELFEACSPSFTIPSTRAAAVKYQTV